MCASSTTIRTGKEKGTALPVQLADWRGGPGCAAGKNGSRVGAADRAAWGAWCWGHEDYPYGARIFQNQILTWSARSGCPGCWTSLWLGRQSRRGCYGGALKQKEKVPFMWMIFWGLLLFVFLTFVSMASCLHRFCRLFPGVWG